MDQKPLSDAWDHGDPYEQFVGRWSRQVAPLFLHWLGVPPGRRWLDVGCGTGALSAAILERCSPAFVVGVEPSQGFLESARRRLAGRATLDCGSATAIPLRNESIDVVVSALVLNFIPDLPAALAEMVRVTSHGGLIGAYVWDYAGKMELIRHFWDAAASLDARALQLDEGVRFPLCRPEALTEAFATANLRSIEVTAIDIPTRFPSFDDYWQPFLGGQGPAPAYAMSLDESARVRLREHLRNTVPSSADGSISMTARAWAVRGSL